MERAWLGEFLRRRREALSPQDVGLPARPPGRTPGLRREEVAALASVSTTYYERLEQGRGPNPSAAVLATLSTALRLTPDEEAHLHRLAGHTTPARPNRTTQLDPTLEHLLTAIEETTPAFVTDDLGNVLAQNWLNITLLGRYQGNLIWRWFTDPTWRHRLDPPDRQEQTGFAYVADLRAVLAEHGPDGPAGELLQRLNDASAEFRTMWDHHAVASLHCPTKVVHDPASALSNWTARSSPARSPANAC
ncbi:helix-turn-helix transcriptional regulator [Cryptosporangium sp. NPDC048952]|uniref:helix-turn-helix transcriptional regulator n=1 Tax=Cryptosporangium sp. NPDC048952 TaxID=3363961 RepID=UPI0037101825